jgi:hypothetical protein
MTIKVYVHTYMVYFSIVEKSKLTNNDRQNEKQIWNNIWFDYYIHKLNDN